MGDRRHQEQQSLQPLCDDGTQSRSAMAELPAHAPFPHVLGKVVRTLRWRGAGYHTSSQQQCALVPYPLGQIVTELKQDTQNKDFLPLTHTELALLPHHRDFLKPANLLLIEESKPSII